MCIGKYVIPEFKHFGFCAFQRYLNCAKPEVPCCFDCGMSCRALTSVRRIVGNDQTHERGFKVLYRVSCSLMSLESSVGVVTRLQAGQPRYHSIARGGKISSRVSILAIEPTKPPIYCVHSALSLVVKQAGHEYDYLHPLLSLRMNGAVLESS